MVQGYDSSLLDETSESLSSSLNIKKEKAYAMENKKELMTEMLNENY